jgi:hypothetical protein
MIGASVPKRILVAAVYGLLAAATNSTYPSMVLHAGGNVFSAFSLFTQGRSEWQLTAVPPPTIWRTGIDGSFLASLAILAVVGAATVMAYRGSSGLRVLRRLKPPDRRLRPTARVSSFDSSNIRGAPRLSRGRWITVGRH